MEILVAFILLILPITPSVRLCIAPSFIRAFPQVFIFLASALSIYFICSSAFVILFPDWAIPAAILTLSMIFLERWRARAGYGTERRLPPGSLGLFPIDALLDPLALLKRAAIYGPVFKMTGSLRRAGMSGWPAPMICVVGLERAHELLVRQYTKLDSPENAFNRIIPRGFLRYMAQADHDIYRPILQAVISPKIAKVEELFIEEQIRRCLAEMEWECKLANAGIFPLPHLSQLIFTIWAGLFLGILPSSPDLARLKSLFGYLDLERTGFWARRQAKEALAAITAMMRVRVECWNSLMPSHCYLAELLALNPNALADPTLVQNFIYLMQTSWKDVESLMQWILNKLGESPDWLAQVRAETGSSPNIQERIARETCRLAQSEYVIRRAREDINLDNYRIPKGWLIRICVRESHLDPGIFEDPVSFDPDRFRDREYSRTEYAPFGMGPHACIGAQLTLAIAKKFILGLARGYDLQTTADGAREFRRFHWQPSSKFRVRLIARA